MPTLLRSSAADQTARLLNAQAVHLDVVDVRLRRSARLCRTDDVQVVSAVPPTWPLAKLSSFLSRSLRRTLHARHEGMIVKAIAAGQNLEVCMLS